jgi:hypothetical protein
MNFFLAAVDLSPVQLTDSTAFVDQTLAYVMPSILTFCTAAVSFKVLIYFFNAGKVNDSS